MGGGGGRGRGSFGGFEGSAYGGYGGQQMDQVDTSLKYAKRQLCIASSSGVDPLEGSGPEQECQE